MAFTQIPTPGQDYWQQLATSTPTSGSALSFTSINANYRKLYLASTKVTLTATDIPYIRFNSVSAADFYVYNVSAGTGSSNIVVDTEIEPNATGTNILLGFNIENPIGVLPIRFDGIFSTVTSSTSRRINFGHIPGTTTSVTQIDLTLPATTFSASNTGAITLYGTY